MTSLGIAILKNDKVGQIIDDLGNNLLNCDLQIFSVYPSGRAQEKFSSDEFIKDIKTSENHRCVYNGAMAIDFDGKLFPCCSQLIVNTKLNVGNISEIDYDTALSRIKNNGILYILRNIGLSFFVDIAKNDLNIKIPDYITSPCEICSILFTKEHINKFYPYVKSKIQEVKRNAEIPTY